MFDAVTKTGFYHKRACLHGGRHALLLRSFPRGLFA
jgi:hypothetical protein